MSWFARSIANTFNFDDDEQEAAQSPKKQSELNESSSPLSPNRGMKEDLSELTKTLTTQFWGVASFLAPPSSADEGSDPGGAPGIRSDFADLGGRFRSGISKLSNNMAAVSEITTKMASEFLQLGLDDVEEERDYSGGGVVGVNDDVVAFVRDIAMHPETWLDFPLPEEEQGNFLTLRSMSSLCYCNTVSSS